MNLGKSKCRKFYLITGVNLKGGENVEYMRPFTNKKKAKAHIKSSNWMLRANVKLLTFECTKEEQIIGGKSK